MTRLHIAVDAHRLTCQPQTGVATYLRGLLEEWVQFENGPDLDLVVPFLPDANCAESILRHPRVRLVHPNRPFNPVASYRAQVWWQEWMIPALIRKSRPDVYLSPFHLTPQFPRSVKVVTTIHDLCFFEEKRWSMGWIVHGAQLWSACLRAARLICVSKFTFDQLAQWSPRFAKKAEVVSNGMRSQMMAMDEAKQKLQRLCPALELGEYLLWIGSPVERKNVELLFDVFAAHQQAFPRHRFVLVAPADTHERLRVSGKARGISETLHLLSGLDALDCRALYRCALALVFPSQCEGFGYPTLEAMFQGCPAFSLQGTAMHELVQGLLPVAESPKADAFISLVRQIAALSDTEREQLSGALSARASVYSARRMAEQTLDVLQTVTAT